VSRRTGSLISSFLMPAGLARVYVILFFTAALVFAMQTTLNVPTWVVLSELFPLDMRGLGMGISVLVLWVTNATISFVFPILVATVQIQGAFLVFVALGLIAIFSLNKLLPETGKRSLEELEEAFAAGNFR
jgi:MFS transporter, SP family, major inositol transporter